MSRKCTGAARELRADGRRDRVGGGSAGAGAVEAAQVTTEETAEDPRLSIGCGAPAHRRGERETHTLSQRRLLIFIFEL